jgi:hypothetical protein
MAPNPHTAPSTIPATAPGEMPTALVTAIDELLGEVWVLLCSSSRKKTVPHIQASAHWVQIHRWGAHTLAQQM